MLQGKTVLLGVTGGIAAYKAAALASALVKQHCHVEVILTEHATQFITPLTFEQLTGNRAMVDTFDRNFSHQVEHIALAQRTDLVLIAPATANVCAKLAHGLADDSAALEELALADDRQRRVNAALEQLPRDMAAAVRLVYFEEMTYAEAARVMGKKSKQVDNLLYRAKRELQSILGEEGMELL